MTIWNKRSYLIGVLNFCFSLFLFFFLISKCRVQATIHHQGIDPPCLPARFQCHHQNLTRPRTPRTWTRLKIYCLSIIQCQCQSEEIRNLSYLPVHPHLDLTWTDRIQEATINHPIVAARVPIDGMAEETAQLIEGRVSHPPTRPCWRLNLMVEIMWLCAQTVSSEEK